MTKKDFIEIAAGINSWIATSVEPDGSQVSVDHAVNLVCAMVIVCLKSNPRFDMNKFIEACIKNTTVRMSDFK